MVDDSKAVNVGNSESRDLGRTVCVMLMTRAYAGALTTMLVNLPICIQVYDVRHLLNKTVYSTFDSLTLEHCLTHGVTNLNRQWQEMIKVGSYGIHTKSKISLRT